MGDQTQEIKFLMGTGSDAQMSFTGMTFTALDKKLYIARDEIANKYFVTDLDENIAKSMQKTFGEDGNMPPQFQLRYGDNDEQIIKSLAFGMLQNPKIAGFSTIEADGKKLSEIKLRGDDGSGLVHVDPQSKLLKDVSISFSPEGAPPGTNITANITMDPKVVDKLPEPIAFAAGDRKAVSKLDDLEPGLSVGDPAPDFTLPTLNDEKVTLSSLKGNVVILDFWATWCGPCRKGLPLLQQFSTWVESSGKPVKVYAVDVWQREEGDEGKKAAVQKFWTDQKFTMPTLVDYAGDISKLYQFQSIPTTIIIGPDGTIKAVHTGYSPEMVEMLKKEVDGATKVSG
jgi:cytochrome c biogenesis protein CcmG/thiol:disulfide interchange protein DsbE